MEVLKLSEIVGYLPYGLKCADFSVTQYGLSSPLIGNVDCANVMKFIDGDTNSKIFLRPLSDLTKEIEVDGKKFVPMSKILDEYDFLEDFLVRVSAGLIRADNLPYYVVQKLYYWHFDIHNLINRGLAVDINTI